MGERGARGIFQTVNMVEGLTDQDEQQMLRPADPIDDFVLDGAPTARILRMTRQG